MLNNCSVARDARRYNTPHDAVLSVIAAVVKPNIPQTSTLTVDISDSYSFPLHIVDTDLRPDLVWWDERHRYLHTVCFEANFVEAAERKSANYMDLAEQGHTNGYKTSLLTLLVGSRGVPDLRVFEKLAKILNLSSKELSQLLTDVSRVGSFSIWCSRNRLC